MSVERETKDAGVVPAKEVWPRRFLERTPTLGWTPNLADDEVAELVAQARRAVRKPFGSVATAVEADGLPGV